MKKRLLLAAICILTLPIWFAPSEGDKSIASPFATVAVAGHLMSGGVYCDGTPPTCGHGVNSLRRDQADVDDFSLQDDPLVGDDSLSDLGRSFVSVALIIGIAIMMWTRSRS